MQNQIETTMDNELETGFESVFFGMWATECVERLLSRPKMWEAGARTSPTQI